MTRPSRAALAVLLALAFPAAANGFVLPKSASDGKQVGSPVTHATLVPSLHASISKSEDNESSRKFRRTVYGFEDWPKHRSTDRFKQGIESTFKSQINKGLTTQIATVASVATVVCAWNCLALGYTDFEGAKHAAPYPMLPPAVLPLTAFTLTTSALSLLLVFRTNASYGRWDEARKMWGLMINRSRDIVRMSVTWYAPGTERTGFLEGGQADPVIDEEERQRKIDKVSKSVWSFSRALARHLTPADDPDEGEEAFQRDVRERLDPEQAEALIASDHRPNRAMFDIGCAINDLPMHFIRRDEIDADVKLFEDISGGCERIFGTPIPLVYTRHSARFLGLYLLFLPLGLWAPYESTWNHIAMIPSACVVALFLMGISELAISLEEPFSILPLMGISNKIGANCDELASWTPYTTGPKLAEKAKPEFSYANPPAPALVPEDVTPEQIGIPPPKRLSKLQSVKKLFK